jgi:HSP20 family molecular chaperone IbpA
MNTENKMNKRNEAMAEKLNDRRSVQPFVDVYENKDEVLLVADLPGVKKEAVSISFEKNQLTIVGKVEGATADESFDYRRAFAVPNGIDADKIQATMALGVLRVSLPKSAALKPRTIEVRAG